MGKIFRIVFIILFPVISAGFLSTHKADAEEGTCVLEAAHKDVFVIVWDQDDEGNKGHQIWQGRINQGNPPRSQRRMPLFAIVIMTSRTKISP